MREPAVPRSILGRRSQMTVSSLGVVVSVNVPLHSRHRKNHSGSYERLEIYRASKLLFVTSPLPHFAINFHLYYINTEVVITMITEHIFLVPGMNSLKTSES